ncbi:hypothetical protein EGI31_15940 [Lacihabitans soyangensis]|uniref:Uncharacterized protein n=1 Tax=Lacihabitans soyangensis TaxID=869394 RepID=A0AAE3H5A4_9BACT|nr:hypothetical protein [Lacihabitans soyangensis]
METENYPYFWDSFFLKRTVKLNLDGIAFNRILELRLRSKNRTQKTLRRSFTTKETEEFHKVPQSNSLKKLHNIDIQ